MSVGEDDDYIITVTANIYIYIYSSRNKEKRRGNNLTNKIK
jgi:hypothetical protein